MKGRRRLGLMIRQNISACMHYLLYANRSIPARTALCTLKAFPEVVTIMSVMIEFLKSLPKSLDNVFFRFLSNSSSDTPRVKAPPATSVCFISPRIHTLQWILRQSSSSSRRKVDISSSQHMNLSKPDCVPFLNSQGFMERPPSKKS